MNGKETITSIKFLLIHARNVIAITRDFMKFKIIRKKSVIFNVNGSIPVRDFILELIFKVTKD